MFRTHPRVKEFVGSCMKKEVIELSRPELFVSNVELGFKFARHYHHHPHPHPHPHPHNSANHRAGQRMHE